MLCQRRLSFWRYAVGSGVGKVVGDVYATILVRTMDCHSTAPLWYLYFNRHTRTQHACMAHAQVSVAARDVLS